jgi:putative transposase
MARPYAMDLRERVIAAVLRGGMSCREAAKHFGVAASTAIQWVQRVRATGSAAPGKIGGYRRQAISGAHRRWLVERCKAADFTLRGLVAEMAERGLKVDYRTMWNFVHAEGLSYKKRLCVPANRIAPRSRAGVHNGGATRAKLTPRAWCLLTKAGQRPT